MIPRVAKLIRSETAASFHLAAANPGRMLAQMKVRSPLLSLALALLSAAAGQAAQSTWVGSADSLVSNLLNWTGDSPVGANLEFNNTTILPIVTVDTPLAANSLKFNGLYPSYSFSATNGAALNIGPGGIDVASHPSSSVDFTSSLPVQLSASQTWNINGGLRVAGPISSTGASSAVLTKTGTGTLTLAGNSTFNGGVLLQQGTLLIETGSTGVNGTIDAGSLGLGGLTISAGTTFGAAKPNLILANSLALDSGAILTSGSNDERGRGLLLTGPVTTSSKDVVVTLSGSNPLTFSGTLDGPANTAIRFQSSSTGRLDGAALAGVTTANVTSLIADHAALYFVTPSALPSSLTVQAVNNGYVGIAATSGSASLAVSAVLDRIVDPAAFAGTFGFDTEPNSGAPHVYREDLDFRAFTHTSFKIGSSTEAVLTGTIAPPFSGGTTAYRFGSGGGHLFVQSDLGDAVNPGPNTNVPTSVAVSSPAGEDISGIVLGGQNTFSGTITVGGVTSNLRVDRAMVILDSAGALPAGASFSLGDASYIGSTEAAGFTTFADFLSRAATGGYDANSVFGLDSHAFIQEKMTQGDQSKTNAARVVTESLDLRSLSTGFFGTLTRVRIEGAVRAPSTGILQITGVSEGALSITSALAATNADGTPNVGSVVVGYPSSSGVDEFGESKVELTGASTYTGGTTLQSGTLVVGGTSTVNSGALVSGPLGTGTLTVATNPDGVVLASNSETGVTLFNAIVLNGRLQLGQGDPQQNPSTAGAIAPNPLTLAGNISGTAGIEGDGHTLLSGTNSYSGGTHARSGTLVFASPTAVPTAGTLKSDVNAYIGLQSAPTSAQTGFIDRFDPASTHGTIGFDTDPSVTTPTVFSDNLSLAAFTSTSTRIGSSSAAKLMGTITPAGSTYRFGGGGGYLEVSSPLTGSANGVEVSSPHGASLTLRLSGANTYLGPTNVSNSALIFGAGAIPASSPFTMDPNGYIGSDDTSLDADFSPFLNRFATNLGQGTIGFDAVPGSTGRIINAALDLSRFTTADFTIGTSTALTFGTTSTLTLPTAGTAYRFAGYKGGRLQIDTVLSGAKGLVIGNPTSLMSQVSPAGVTSAVVLNAANTFTGGTTLFSGELFLGPSSVVTGSIVSGPLGTGTLTVQPTEFSNGGLRPTLRPVTGPVTIDNPIVLNSGLGVASGLTLAGSISGAAGIYKVDAGTLTVSGNNSSWTGGVFINEGEVAFTQDTSAGTGMLRLGGLVASTATFTSAAPTIGSLAGDNPGDQLVLAANSVLNISQAGQSQYYGQISGAGAGVTVQGFDPNVDNQLILGGANSYTGGTTIGSNAVVIATHNNALGTTGGVTLNQGGLAVAEGVTTTFSASHPLTLNGGTLGGTGTLAFHTSVNIKGGANGAVVLSPGVNNPGKLNLSFPTGATLILDSGGRYHWKLMDATNASAGWDTIAVTGGVDITATALAPFDLTIATVSGNGDGEAVNFDVYSSYSWTLLTATSAITGFDSTKFNLDTTNFANRTLDGTFSVSLDGAGTSLMLNYTAAAIPEPSTWAMMIIGVFVVAYSSLRRRRN